MENKELKVARVFPRKTSFSPDDKLAFFGPPPITLSIGDFCEAHISVTFSYDLAAGKRLADDWNQFCDVKIGGPALGDPGEIFVSGRYLRKGYVITSRGCPNNCWFCDVPKREGREMRELPITEGDNILDSNLLACSDIHIIKVFEMLERQNETIKLTGGLEAARLKTWHIEWLWKLRPKIIFFAYDTPDDLAPLIEVGKLMRYADFTRNHLRCYVLIGYPNDDFSSAEDRLVTAWKAGFLPMAMLWRDKKGLRSKEWARFQRLWARPALIKRTMRTNFFKKWF